MPINCNVNKERAKIVVLTPVKNEAWGIKNFLTLVTKFADIVIVLDQNSSDDSIIICREFEKVYLFNNPSEEYDEGYRQRLLISKARQLVREKMLLVALDVDEFPDAQSLNSGAWESLRFLDAGTAVYFQKPEIFLSPLRMELPGWYLLGYMDDGQDHIGTKVHSDRLPGGSSFKKFKEINIRFLHLACTRENEYRARQAYYALKENIGATKSWLMRNWYYSSKIIDRRYEMASLRVPTQWVDYSDLQISIEKTTTHKFNDFHLKCLFLFLKYGTQRFKWDDIWRLDWDGAWHYYSLKYPELIKPKQPNHLQLKVIELLRIASLYIFSLCLNIKTWIKRTLDR